MKIVFKVIMLGDSGVGKSSLVKRSEFDQFSPTFATTVGIDFILHKEVVKPGELLDAKQYIEFRKQCKEVNVDPDEDVQFVMQLWDTAGQERYRTITRAYYRAAVAIIYVYDVSAPKKDEPANNSFNNLQSWIDEVTEHTHNNQEKPWCLMVGNKMDRLQRQTAPQVGESFAKEHGMAYVEMSAKSGMNVKSTFDVIFKRTAAGQLMRHIGIMCAKKQGFNNPIPLTTFTHGSITHGSITHGDHEARKDATIALEESNTVRKKICCFF